MRATLNDTTFGRLVWEEDAESYRGSVELRPGETVTLTLIVHNADGVVPREFAAFLTAARTQCLGLRQDNARFRQRAAEVIMKALLLLCLLGSLLKSPRR